MPNEQGLRSIREIWETNGHLAFSAVSEHGFFLRVRTLEGSHAYCEDAVGNIVRQDADLVKWRVFNEAFDAEENQGI